MLLNLKSVICKLTGTPKSYFKEEFQNKKDFCTVKEFIDNPDTVETFRFMNSYDNTLDFSNDVYEYLDTLFYDEKECIKRKKQREKIKWF